MTAQTDRLNTALAGRYRIERHLGADRFVVEIKTTASLQHPHILSLFDSGTADGFLFYVMPFIEGVQ
jgi:serine/threonine-protein kinase